MPQCKKCSHNFEITEDDLKFYNKVSPTFNGEKQVIPAPQRCSYCRQQRRMTHRNERSIYGRSCDKCNKNIVSIYHPNSKNTVYCKECWWGDDWNALDYGQDFDFNRSFFEQFYELILKVPQLFMMNANSENSDYANYGFRNKNCYLLMASDDCEDCFYGSYAWNSNDCMDCLYLIKSELCYELVNCLNCFHCLFSQQLENCNDCLFCFDLKGCSDCFGSVGLRNKKYYWFNKQLSKEEYENKLKEIKFDQEKINEFNKRLNDLKSQVLHKYANLINCENCTGDNLKDSKNANNCYDSYDLEDCKFILNGPGKVKDCYDFCGCKELELSYEGIATGGSGTNLLFNSTVWNSDNITYSSLCSASSNLFGCVALHHKKHCVLNKQYSKEEYEELVPKIIEHMEKTGEWGEYFPVKFSVFAYNETIAQDYYPLSKEQVLENGWRWKDDENIIKNDQTSKDVLECNECKKSYKIIVKEKAFLEKNNLPFPNKCPNCRHKSRIALRNPYRLHDRNCNKCNSDIKTSYSPDSLEKIYCEKCYLAEVY